MGGSKSKPKQEQQQQQPSGPDPMIAFMAMQQQQQAAQAAAAQKAQEEALKQSQITAGTQAQQQGEAAAKNALSGMNVGQQAQDQATVAAQQKASTPIGGATTTPADAGFPHLGVGQQLARHENGRERLPALDFSHVVLAVGLAGPWLGAVAYESTFSRAQSAVA